MNSIFSRLSLAAFLSLSLSLGAYAEMAGRSIDDVPRVAAQVRSPIHQKERDTDRISKKRHERVRTVGHSRSQGGNLLVLLMLISRHG